MEEYLSDFKHMFNQLCLPSKIFTVLGLIGGIALFLNKKIPNILKISGGLNILFWIFVYDALCKNGYTTLSWVLVAFTCLVPLFLCTLKKLV